MSFHATKAFSSGEGGCIACGGSAAAIDALRALNFGFYDDRNAVAASTNGKMSEYHAAVGLAELDGWAAKRAQLEGVVALYVDAFASVGLSDRLVCAPAVGLSYMLFQAGDVAESASVQRTLRAHGVDFRLWYGRGVHRHTYFARVARRRLDTAEDLAARLIGLPVAPDLAPGEVKRVADAVSAGTLGEAGYLSQSRLFGHWYGPGVPPSTWSLDPARLWCGPLLEQNGTAAAGTDEIGSARFGATELRVVSAAGLLYLPELRLQVLGDDLVPVEAMEDPWNLDFRVANGFDGQAASYLEARQVSESELDVCVLANWTSRNFAPLGPRGDAQGHGCRGCRLLRSLRGGQRARISPANAAPRGHRRGPHRWAALGTNAVSISDLPDPPSQAD